MAATFWLSASFIWHPMVQMKNVLPFGGRRRGDMAAGTEAPGTMGMIGFPDADVGVDNVVLL